MSRLDAELVLALYPFTRGFAFVLFEGKDALIDWGIKEIRGTDKQSRTMQIIRSVIDRVAPDVIVLEDVDARTSRRTPRIRTLHGHLKRFARARQITVACYTKYEVRKHFPNDTIRVNDDLAHAVVRALPVLAPYLPPRRKFYQNEDRRLSLFAAAALGLTYRAHAGGDADAIPA